MVYHTLATVATAGTPTTLASVSTKADWIQVSPGVNNVGAIYLGGANQVCGNGSGGLYGIPITPSGSENGAYKGFFFPVISYVRSPYDLSKITINADNSGDTAVIYYGRG